MGSLDELGIEVVLASRLVGLENKASRVHSLDEDLRFANRFQLSLPFLAAANRQDHPIKLTPKLRYHPLAYTSPGGLFSALRAIAKIAETYIEREFFIASACVMEHAPS